MRNFVLCFLAAALAVLVAGRALLPEPAAAAAAVPDYGYNMLDIVPPPEDQTAGSALISEMTGYYFSRTPTAKSAYTGALAGKNLILICAEAWAPDVAVPGGSAVYALWRAGAHFTQVYLPEWYQGADGRIFAMLSGLMPTAVRGETALSQAGRQDIFLPFALARALADRGYDCRAYVPGPCDSRAYEALGFGTVRAGRDTARDTVTQTMGEYLYAPPFFAFYFWPDADGGPALECLLRSLEASGLAGDTAVCLLTGDVAAGGGQLYLSGDALSGVTVDRPCSELDITPTLLDLLGVDFDSRFLSGRDVFAENAVCGTASDATPLVSLFGSAYADWVTDAGSSTGGAFCRREGCFPDRRAARAYAKAVADMVYERYVFARRIMENNYFALLQ